VSKPPLLKPFENPPYAVTPAASRYDSIAATVGASELRRKSWRGSIRSPRFIGPDGDR